MPIKPTVSLLVKFGNPPVHYAPGGLYYVDKPTGGPDWGGRFGGTVLFPK